MLGQPGGAAEAADPRTDDDDIIRHDALIARLANHSFFIINNYPPLRSPIPEER
jgi:hypothetical protein